MRCICLLFLLLVQSASAELLQDIQTLSSETMQGRKTASDGAELARQFLARRFETLKLEPLSGDYRQLFQYGFAKQKQGVNMLALRRGCRFPSHYIVVTAHYDHLGRQGRKIFNGADDNASGVAAMLELARRLSQHCPAYSYLFVATDAEENGLYGSKAFVAAPPVPLSNMVLNLNLDMLGHPDRRGRLYLTGARKIPALMTELAAAFDKLQFLHHRGPTRLAREQGRQDWANASDHGPFHRQGITYLFFGGQEHARYHTPQDTWQNIDTAFLTMAMSAVWQTVLWLEQQPPAQLQAANH